MVIKDQFTFKLSRPLLYGADGTSSNESTELTIVAPCNRDQALVIELTQGLTKALFSVAPREGEELEREKAKQEKAKQEKAKKAKQKKHKDLGEEEPEKPKKSDPDTYVMLLFNSDIDMVDYFETFKNLITRDRLALASVFVRRAKDVQLTEDLYDSLSARDTRKLLGEYIEHFLSPNSTE